MNVKELTELLNAKIEIKPEPIKQPLTANELNDTLDTFATKLNDTFKQLGSQKQEQVIDETQQGEITNDKQ